MSKLNRLVSIAKKAMDAGSSSSQHRGASSQGDWMTKARGAVESLLGDERSTDRRPAGSPWSPPSTPSAHPGAGAPGSPTALQPPAPHSSAGVGRTAPSGSAQDRAAIARYDYLLRTAHPEQIEQVHREAFARLTPDQRAQVAARLGAELPPDERPRSSDSPELARVAARTEAMQPGRLRGILARSGGIAGGVAAGGLLATVAGGAILTGVGASLIGEALSEGIDFEAIAGGLDVSAIAENAGGFVSGAGEYAQGLGDQVSEAGGGLSDLASGFGLPGLDDLLGR
ncbi:cation-transporting ATPase [Microbacterium paludicola]|uniref:Cation-transporting ATPase n=1 Tax=Microbacterium paludicola TaxID=300019 RepID=A0A4Y9FP55_9MICO|nr:cation-transporting ATPase [Microbacterium paludicola]MBF0817671.1 cation-transporting ATPase [Microbacterium paludicola]TFU30313.1 cation-transporting ATPase [Microbacterium paludicola]